MPKKRTKSESIDNNISADNDKNVNKLPQDGINGKVVDDVTSKIDNENCEVEINKNSTSSDNAKVENLDSDNGGIDKQSKQSRFNRALDKFFKISERGSSVKNEFIGGLVNFLVLSYTLVVIPGLFNGIASQDMWKALFLSTIITTIICTICMALHANLPLVMAPGIGLCSYVVQLIKSGQYTYQQSLSICFISGIIFLILTITGFRKRIIGAIPTCIKISMPIGVGLFILSIGLSSSNSGILDLLNGSATSFAPIIALVSFIIMVVLYIKNIKASIFIGIASGTILDIILKFCTGTNPFKPLMENSWLPPFKQLGENGLFKFDFAGLFSGNIAVAILSVFLIVFAVTLIDMFDTVGTLYATAKKGNLFDKEGNVLNMNRAMLVDGSAALVSTCFGVPNMTTYVESTAGIASGARTGLSSIFTSLMFLVTMFLSPLVMIIPVYATAPALILVGILMFDSVVDLDFKDLSQLIPSVLTIIVMPLTNNITLGIAIGLVSYTIIKMCQGKFKQISAFTYVITIFFIAYFVLVNLI